MTNTIRVTLRVTASLIAVMALATKGWAQDEVDGTGCMSRGGLLLGTKVTYNGPGTLSGAFVHHIFQDGSTDTVPVSPIASQHTAVVLKTVTFTDQPLVSLFLGPRGTARSVSVDNFTVKGSQLVNSCNAAHQARIRGTFDQTAGKFFLDPVLIGPSDGDNVVTANTGPLVATYPTAQVCAYDWFGTGRTVDITEFDDNGTRTITTLATAAAGIACASFPVHSDYHGSVSPANGLFISLSNGAQQLTTRDYCAERRHAEKADWELPPAEFFGYLGCP